MDINRKSDRDLTSATPDAEGDSPGIPPSPDAETEAYPAATPPPAEDPRVLELETCRTEKAELFDRLLRKQAEFENYRKRQDREKKELAQTVRMEVLREFLPVADACERALKALADAEHGMADAGSFRSGIELIYKQFLDTLARFDIRPIDAVGQPFDPARHHAILREETDRHPENQVLEELQKGYAWENRLLRPSQVKVAIAPASR